MQVRWSQLDSPGRRPVLAALVAATLLAGCGTARLASPAPTQSSVSASSAVAVTPAPPTAASSSTSDGTRSSTPPATRRRPATATGAAGGPPVTAPPLPAPTTLRPFASPAQPGEGVWHAAGRRVDGVAAVYETSLRPPGSGQPTGVAWMDSRLLAARLYSGSVSPGGGPWRFTAPVLPAQAATLVAAFNGGFKMSAAGGGYYTQRRVVVPLRTGAASMVLYANGSTAIGAWGTDVSMTPAVTDVRQNLDLLVDAGQPTAQTADWQSWGATIGGVVNVWRSGVGVTAAGALVYAMGPNLDPVQLAQVLVRAGAVRAMQLDINPDWTVLATYNPAAPTGAASPANGTNLVAGSVQGPWTFFEPTWARDFFTMSARSGPIP